MRIFYLTLIILTSGLLSPLCAQIGMGTVTPQAALDITSTNNGVLIPRVLLTATNVAAPVVNPLTAGIPATGTLVYNTNTFGVTPNNVIPGFYYWDGIKWVALTGSAAPPDNAWNLTGNAGTNTATNFVGTTDNVDLHFRANGNNKFRISTTANQILGYGGTAASPTYSWDGFGGSGMWLQGAGNVRFSTGGTARFQIPVADQVHAMSDGTAAIPFYSWSTDPDIGMYRPAANNLGFSTAGLDRLRIIADGNVGIGNTTPRTKTEIGGALSLNEGTALTFANGVNNDVALGAIPYSMYRVAGPTAAFSLTGLVPVASANGQIVTIQNTTAFPLTLVHNATSVAANRIFCPGAKNMILTGQYATVTLQYNASQTKWVIIGYVGEVTSVNQRDIYAVKGTTDLNLTPAVYPSGGTFTDMSQMTLTVTPKNNIIYVNFGAAGDLSVSPQLPGSNNIGFRLVNVGTGAVLGGTTSVTTDYDFDDVYGEMVATGWNAHFTMYPIAVTAGVPITLKIQWSAAAIYGAQVHNYVLSSPSYAHRNLTIID